MLAIWPVGVLQDVRVRAVQDARPTGLERRGVVAQRRPAPAGFDADQLDRRVVDERRERADRVRPAADARDHAIRQPSERFATTGRAPRWLMTAWNVAHDRRVRVRPDDRADQVVARLDRRHPVAEGLADGVLQRARAARSRAALRRPADACGRR